MMPQAAQTAVEKIIISSITNNSHHPHRNIIPKTAVVQIVGVQVTYQIAKVTR